MRRRTEEGDLLAITPAPFAEQQMNAQTETFADGKPAVQRGGLKPRGFAAAWRKHRHSSCERLQKICEPVHLIFAKCVFGRRCIQRLMPISRRRSGGLTDFCSGANAARRLPFTRRRPACRTNSSQDSAATPCVRDAALPTDCFPKCSAARRCLCFQRHPLRAN